MNRFVARILLTGALTLPFSYAMSAEMDRVVFSHPVRAIPADNNDSYRDENISGFVEGSFAYGKGKAGGSTDDGTRWALRGSVNAQADTNWNIQIDGLYSQTSVGPADIDSLVGAAHANYRVQDAYAVGAFVQAARFRSGVLNALAPLGLDNYAADVIGGGEAALYTDMATFHGQLGFGSASYSGFKADHLLAKAGVRLYATDNIRFDLEGTLDRLTGYGATADLYSISAIGNYRFGQLPASVFGGYQYDHGNASVNGVSVGSATAHTVLTGLRFHFGSETLKDEERNGPVWSSSALNL